MSENVLLLILVGVALGGVLVLLSTGLTGFLSFKLKRDAGESFLNSGASKGAAFVLDDVIDGPGAPKGFNNPYPSNSLSGGLMNDPAGEALQKETAKFLQQLAEEKARKGGKDE